MPTSWLPKSEQETFLLRVVAAETVALLGLLAKLISVVCDFVLSGAAKVASDPQRQMVVDELAEDLSWAIHDLLNRKVSDEAGVSRLESEYGAWCQRVSEKLENRAFFSRAQQLHFDRLGFVPPANCDGSFNAYHEWLVSQLKLKFERLRDIINK